MADLGPIALDDEGSDETLAFVVADEASGDRLDRYLTSVLPTRSRTGVQALIESGHVLVDGLTRKANFRLTAGDRLTVVEPPLVPTTLRPEPIPLDVVFEDDDVIVINKPAGLVVHPAPGHPTGTLVNALLHRLPGIAVGGTDRPGLVHRLDKDTSGLLVAAKSDRGFRALTDQWNTRSVRKDYLALTQGDIDPDEATIDAPIGRDPQHRQKMAVLRGGRDAVTHFTVTERFGAATLADVTIETGRTHQIRVHLAFIGHPVVGDHIYGARNAPLFDAPRQMLHAYRLGFKLPTGKTVEFTLDPPADFTQVTAALETATHAR